MKKTLSVLLALSMLIALFSPVFASETVSEPAGAEAAVIVPGVIETMLMIDPAAGRSGRFYQPVTEVYKGLIKELVLGAFKAMFLFSYDTLTDAVLQLEDAALRNLTMNPDGTSKFDIKTPVSGAAESSYAAMRRNGTWDAVDYGAQIAPSLAAEIGEENVFVFAYDWRLGSPTLTERFRDFLSEVKALTGCEKVHVYSDSYGCQIVAMYLYKYGGGEDFDRIVFDSPAWTGTALFKNVMAESKKTLHFNLTDGARVLLNFAEIEEDYARLMKLVPDRIVQHIAFAMLRSAMEKYLLAAPGLWCCCSVREYEEMKAKYLDPAANAAVIREVDEAQYGVMRHIPEVLADAQAAGISVSVIMNEGTPLLAGKNVNGDGVVDAASGSGGECLPLGETFTDGRSGAHVSPANDYDLTNAFLPERTWVFYGQTHGQSNWDDVSQQLVLKLMLTDDLLTVDSDPMFPQFSDSHCPTSDVSLRLTGRGGSELRSSEGAVQAVIRNDSEKNEITLTGVTVCGLPYTVSPAAGRLKPGETKTVSLWPLPGAAAPANGTIRITYIEKDYLTFAKTRTQYFKLSEIH